MVARETISEKLVRKANNYYATRKLAKVQKNDPQVRIVTNKLIYSGHSGLDFSGVLKGGKYISFEVKETNRMVLPLQNIRMTQILRMQKESEMDTEPFLLVFFKKLQEWYYLSYENLSKVIHKEYSGLPVRFFRAFGLLVTSKMGFPEYLSPQVHSLRNKSREEFPEWLPRMRSPPKRVNIPSKIDHKDIDARRERIIKAMQRGVENAERKEDQVRIYKIMNQRQT